MSGYNLDNYAVQSFSAGPILAILYLLMSDLILQALIHPSEYVLHSREHQSRNQGPKKSEMIVSMTSYPHHPSSVHFQKLENEIVVDKNYMSLVFVLGFHWEELDFIFQTWTFDLDLDLDS